MDSSYKQLPDAEPGFREAIFNHDSIPLIEVSVESIVEHDTPSIEQYCHSTLPTLRFHGLGIVDEEIILEKDYRSSKASHTVVTSPCDPEEVSPTLRGSPPERPLKLQSSAPPSLWRRCLSSWSDTWLPEVLAMVISFLALVAMVAILYLNNHTPSSTIFWRLHVNSWVSGFNTVSKTAITFVTASAISQSKWTWFRKRKAIAAMSLYDSASRGPAGAVTYLWFSKCMSVASLGALITLLALGMDFFVQTTIGSQLISKRVGNATTTRIQNIMSQTFGTSTGGFNSDLMSWAFDEGISGIPIPFSVVCSTGNCTWDHFIASLALCSTCQDISHEIIRATDPNVDGPFGELTNGVSLKPLNIGEKPNIFVANTSALLDPGFGPPDSMVNFTALSIDQAFQCSFYVCVNEYNLSISNGILSQTVVKSWPCNSTDNPDPPNSEDSIIITLPADSYDMAGNQNPSFGIERDLYISLQEFLKNNLAATIEFDVKSSTSGNYSSPSVIDIVAGYNDDYPPSVNLTNIPAITANLTDSLNARMRQPPNLSSVDVINGNAMRMGTYIEVGWYWLIYPFILFFMSAAFLGTTMWMSSRAKVRVWKDSPMPLLFHGLAREHRLQVRTVQKVSEMEQAADTMEVKLVELDDGWKFV
ncbi:hypothetical protein MMC11_002396 [Xylographa trunciseda]|nr:hypothetical protein [Xylographa trunciseda]